MGCENDNLVRTLEYGGDTYEIYNESLDFAEAVDKCKCSSIPSRTLALVKTEEAFTNLSQALSKYKHPPYWRIGLKQEGSYYRWVDGDVLQTRPNYFRSGSGDCFCVYPSPSSAFLRPLQCKGWASHSGIFGYICSFKNQAAPSKITSTTPSPIMIEDEGVSPAPPDQSWNVMIWITIAFLLMCVVVLAILLLLRRQRSNGSDKEPSSSITVLGQDGSTYNRENSVELGQHGYNKENGEDTGYATIEEMQSMSKEDHERFEDITYSEIVPEQNVKDVYAVVNKKKSLVNNDADEKRIVTQETYAVVNKG